MNYFAYGSNLALARLQQRVPSAQFLGRFSLNEHQLRFHMQSQDGSGKCDAYFTQNPEHFVIGAVFKIKPTEKPSLDKAESLGVGYSQKQVNVTNRYGQELQAFTYNALTISGGIKPYSWYLNHVIIGAEEIEAPLDYLKQLREVATVEDPDNARDFKERRIHI